MLPKVPKCPKVPQSQKFQNILSNKHCLKNIPKFLKSPKALGIPTFSKLLNFPKCPIKNIIQNLKILILQKFPFLQILFKIFLTFQDLQYFQKLLYFQGKNVPKFPKFIGFQNFSITKDFFSHIDLRQKKFAQTLISTSFFY